MAISYEEVREIATLAHAGQVRRGTGEPYINHPFRVAGRVKIKARISAALHDVIEDTKVTAEDLRRWGVSEEDLIILDLLTRRDGETYNEFIERIACAPGETGKLAREIKLADIEDNLSGIRNLPLAERGIEKRYLRARKRLYAIDTI